MTSPALLWSTISLAGAIAAAWLAGMVFLALIGEPLEHATPWTLITWRSFSVLPEYWYAIGGVLIGFAGLAALALWPKPEKVHGDAAWATEAQIRRAGLRAKRGILLGQKSGRYLMTENPSHTLLVAPTRSGKGVGVIIPNLLNFDGSTVVLDIKRENFEIAGAFRQRYSDGLYLWSPMAQDGRSHRYNPLAEVRKTRAFRITDLQLIASYLIPLPEKNPVWDQLARQLFTALCMYVMDDPRMEPSIGQVYRVLNARGGASFPDWITELVKTPPEWLDDECDRLLSAYAAMTDKEQAYVRTSLNQALGLWASPLVDAATSVSDFSLADLRRKRTSIFVGVSHQQMSALRPLLSLFFQQVVGKLSECQPGADEPHKVLILLDEFASLGKMQSITSAVTMLAGYGGRLMFVLQGLGTLTAQYGREGAEDILQNCAQQIFFAPNDQTTADYIVQRLGKKTVLQRSKTRTNDQTLRQSSETHRDLMLPQEIRQLGGHEQIVFSERTAPIRARKIVYHQSAVYTKRLGAPPDIPMLDTAARGTLIEREHMAEHRTPDAAPQKSTGATANVSVEPPETPSPSARTLFETAGRLTDTYTAIIEDDADVLSYFDDVLVDLAALRADNKTTRNG